MIQGEITSDSLLQSLFLENVNSQSQIFIEAKRKDEGLYTHILGLSI